MLISDYIKFIFGFFTGCVGLPFPDTQVKIVGTDSSGSTDYDK